MIDNFGRTVTVSSESGLDVYTVSDGAGVSFEVEFPHGTDTDKVLSTINGLAPGSA